ncbi:MAG: glycine--tRNA ligase [Phycisphaerales bacterium]|nr:MAG: glycine--tRNA ligase [Phycisphaerales bacterium]
MSQNPPADTTDNPAKSMDELVALCKRRGFIFPASEIYDGINGFWDYGPLGTELKNNLRDAWWNDMVKSPPAGPDGEPLSILGVDSAIIQHPKTWAASGHVEGFNDPMVDDTETKQRFRADQLVGAWIGIGDRPELSAEEREERFFSPDRTIIASTAGEAAQTLLDDKKLLKPLRITSPFRGHLRDPKRILIADIEDPNGNRGQIQLELIPVDDIRNQPDQIPSPYSSKMGVLTEPRQFNLMFRTFVGATSGEDNVAYLRPETAQGIFLNYKNVLDTMRVKVPFGIAQIGKAFRNEVTPRNFIFRSREFEQMEIEWFCPPEDARKWYEFWCEVRKNWWKSIGLTDANLQMREHENDELAHYAKQGCGCFDVEYRFPFTYPGYGELEGVADRTDFDLRQHEEYSGAKLKYFDQERNEHYFPYVIEPSAGLSRGVLALLCEAFTPTPERKGSKYVMNFHPRMAPIQCAVFPLVNKDGMPEVARKLYDDLRRKYAVQFDVKQSIGKRYARMDEGGTPYCFTIDSETLENNTVTWRERDTAAQDRISIDRVAAFLADRIGG